MDDRKILMRRLAVIRRIANLAQDPVRPASRKLSTSFRVGWRFLSVIVSKCTITVLTRRRLTVTSRCRTRWESWKSRPTLLAMDITSSRGKYPVKGVETSMPWEEIDETINELAELELPQLELFATIHFVQSIRSRWDRSKVIMTVRRLKPKFSEERIEKAYQDIEEMGLIKVRP